MPKLKEAAVAVVGNIVEVESLLAYDRKTQTRTTDKDGVKCLLSTSDGFVLVKVRQLDLDRARPVIGSWVAWLIRFGAWAPDDKAGDASVTCGFVGLVDDEWAGRLGGVITAAKKAS